MIDINIDEYLKYDLIKKAEVDPLLSSSKIDDELRAKLLEVSSIYLKSLSKIQIEFIEKNNFPFDDLSTELKLKLLSYETGISDENFIDLYLKSDDPNLEYSWSIRSKLIELSLIEKSRSKDHEPRSEFLSLKKAITKNDLNEIYRYAWQVSNHDFIDFNNEEKDIVFEALKIQSEGVSIAIGYALTERRIAYGSWEKFWRTASGYNPGDDIEKNYFLLNKSLCIQADYEDERIDMSMFPNLPTIYEDDLYDSDVFIAELDWDLNFEPYEIDFILAVALSTYNDDRKQLLNQVNAYIMTHKNLFQERLI